MKISLIVAAAVTGAALGLAVGCSVAFFNAGFIIGLKEWLIHRREDALLWAALGAVAVIGITYICKHNNSN